VRTLDEPIAPASAPPEHELHDEALQVLAVAHYVLAGITAMTAPVFVYIAWIGWDLVHPAPGEGWSPRPGQELVDPLFWGAVLYFAGGALASLAVMHGALLAYVGRCLARRRRRLFCLIFSVLDMTYIPLGTILGVCVLVLLTKAHVKQQFGGLQSQ
jgi:hypothetical protein